MKKIAIAAGLMLAFVVPQVDAGVFDFSYSFTDTGGGHNVSGQMIGTLQGDNNTVDVSTIQNLIFDGLTQPSMSFTSSSDVYLGLLTSAIPAVTLDGSLMDLFACDMTGGCGIYMFIDYGNGVAALPTGSDFIYQGGSDLGNNTFGLNSPFNPSNWAMSENTSALPVPATLPLLAISAASLVWQRRRQAA